MNINDVCKKYKDKEKDINKIKNPYERALHLILFKLDDAFGIYKNCREKNRKFETCPKMNISNFLKSKEFCDNAFCCCIYNIVLDALKDGAGKQIEFPMYKIME